MSRVLLWQDVNGRVIDCKPRRDDQCLNTGLQRRMGDGRNCVEVRIVPPTNQPTDGGSAMIDVRDSRHSSVHRPRSDRTSREESDGPADGKTQVAESDIDLVDEASKKCDLYLRSDRPTVS
jgi:hypothetical protein